MAQDAIIPQRQDFATVGHLYRSIEWGLARLAEKYGEEWLFVGPRRAQATAAHFGWPELVAITDLDSAQRAIEEILEQGEGPRGNWRDAHFGQFVEILDEYEQLREANPGFAPVRPVLAASVRPSERDAEVPLITDPVTSRVTDLFNVGYEILLQIFERYFAHTEETDAQLKTLADATLGLMLRVIKPLGDLITTLPVGAEHPGRTAGPSFELFYETDYLMPHREAAWALLTERLDEAASFCEVVGGDCGRQTAERLTPVLAALREIAQTLAAHLPAASAQARTARTAAGLEPAELAALLDQARDLAQAAARADRDDEVAGGLAGVAEAAYSVVAVASSAGPGGPPAARLVPRLVDSVLRPLADALGRLPVGPDAHRGIDAGAEAPWPPASGQGDTALDLLWQAATAATSLRVRLHGVGGPPELAEATAALQDLACSLAPPAERASRLASLRDLQSRLPASIQAACNGPYLATNVPRLLNDLGEPIRTTPQLALCRCGASSMKPFCDGAHARIGFTDAKDPKRLPDRRDTYPGQQLTILDNRGICQHSGFCTDRLATVFRAGIQAAAETVDVAREREHNRRG